MNGIKKSSTPLKRSIWVRVGIILLVAVAFFNINSDVAHADTYTYIAPEFNEVSGTYYIWNIPDYCPTSPTTFKPEFELYKGAFGIFSNPLRAYPFPALGTNCATLGGNTIIGITNATDLASTTGQYWYRFNSEDAPTVFYYSYFFYDEETNVPTIDPQPSVATSTQITSLNWPLNNSLGTSTTQHFSSTVWINNVSQPNASRVCVTPIYTGGYQTTAPICQNIIASGYTTFTWNLPVVSGAQYVWYVTVQGSGINSAEVYARSVSRVFCVLECPGADQQTPLPGLADDTATSTVLSTLQSTFLNLRGSFFDKFPFNWLIESGAILVELPNITATSTPIATTTIDFRETNSYINSAFPTTSPATDIDLTVNFFDMNTFLKAGDITAVQLFRTFSGWIILIGTVLYIGRGAMGLIATGNQSGT